MTLSLLDWTPPSQAHSDTSRAAARSIKGKSAAQRAEILAHLSVNGPASDEQLQRELGMAQNSERPRRVELERAGLIRDSGRRATAESGRRVVLWEVVR